jgi:hypothetical protein
MVDPASISIAVTALLAQFGARVLDRGADKVADDLGDALAEPVGDLLRRVRDGAARDGSTARALEQWESEPDSNARQIVLQEALTELLAEDEELTAQLGALIERIEQIAGPASVQQVWGMGAVAGRDIVVNAKYAAGRDQHFGSPPPA